VSRRWWTVAVVALLLTGCSGSADDGGAADHRNGGTVRPAAYVLPACPDLPDQEAVAGGLPDLALPCLGGSRTVNLADLRGRPTVLNVWAAWCEPCSEEMPVLAKGMRAAGDRVQFFGVSYKAPVGFAKQSAKDFGVAFPSVYDGDGDQTVLALRTTAPPQTLFYDADGKLQGRHPGAITSRAQLDDLVQRYLGVQL
jgi:thiol-disulfide isomerase/thioredoxin